MNSKRCIIVGGGISGLAAAHHLTEMSVQRHFPIDITIIDAQSKLGGVIETHREDGFTIESGPDAFITEKPWAIDLCRRLGIKDDVIQTETSNRRSFIFNNGKLVPVPKGFYLIAPDSWKTLITMPLLSWSGKLRMALEWWVPPRMDDSDESLGHFIQRRFGQETFEKIGQPMLGGIYIADPETLSLQATMPKLREMELTYGSVLKGFRTRSDKRTKNLRQASGPRYNLFSSLRKGMGQMIDQLAQKMPRVQMLTSESVVRLQAGHPWKLTLASGQTLEAESVCLATPAYETENLMRRFSPGIAQLLSTIPYESVATINLAYDNIDRDVPKGFGFVVPAMEGIKIIGCSFSSFKFQGRAPEGSHLMRVFIGGTYDRNLLKLDDQQLTEITREALTKTIGLKAEPRWVRIKRYHRSMPQYQIGHATRVDAIEKRLIKHPGLFLTGNSYRGIGIPDCIRHAENISEKMYRFLRSIPNVRTQTGGYQKKAEAILEDKK